MEKGFEYPSYLFKLINHLSSFVKEKKKIDAGQYYHSCDNFADFFACIFSTQAVTEPKYENVYEKLIELYGQFVLPIPQFAIVFSDELGLDDFLPFLLMVQKAQDLENEYKGNFSEFISTFSNSIELYRFIEKYFGIKHLIRTDDMLYMLGLFHSEHGRFQFVVRAFLTLQVMKHGYDRESYKFLLETIARKANMHVNYVALLLNMHVNEWMREARKFKIEEDRKNECTFES